MAVSLVLRFLFLDFESGDYRAFLSPWYDHFVEQGRWASLGQSFSNYYVPYLGLLSLSTLLPLPKLYAIKLISIIFDYLAACMVYRLVERRYPAGRIKYAAFGGTLFLPTVWMNSALWGQCDVIFTTALLAVLWGVVCARPFWALAAFGVAMAFKPQAIFLGPFLGGLFLKGILPWRWVWVPVAAYAACGLPAILAGKPVMDVLLHWLRQENLPALTSGAANLYQWLPTEPHPTLWWLGVALGGGAGVGVMFAMRCSCGFIPPHLGPLHKPRRSRGNETQAHANKSNQSLLTSAPTAQTWLVTAAFLSVLTLPFFLPGMHERYFFAADVFALLYAFHAPRRWFVALWVQAASVLSYLPYLCNIEPVPLPLLTVAIAAAMVVVAHDYARGFLRTGRSRREEAHLDKSSEPTDVGCCVSNRT